MRVVHVNFNAVSDVPLQAGVDVDHGVIDEVVTRTDVGPSEVTEGRTDIIAGVARNGWARCRRRRVSAERLVVRDNRIEIHVEAVIDFVLSRNP